MLIERWCGSNVSWSITAGLGANFSAYGFSPLAGVLAAPRAAAALHVGFRHVNQYGWFITVAFAIVLGFALKRRGGLVAPKIKVLEI